MSTPDEGHYCSACGQRHETHHGPNPEVQIAKIQAERDVEVARINRGEWVKTAEIAAETELAVTELETAAAVEVAAELGPPEPEEPETQAIVVEGPPAEPIEEEPTIEEAETSSPPPPESKKRSLSYW